VPGGYYWLEPAGVGYWTSSSTFDFGTDLNAPTFSGTVGVSTTTINANLDGLDPLLAEDEVSFLWGLPPIVLLGSNGASSLGATTMSVGAITNSNAGFSQPEPSIAVQYEPETAGSLNLLKLGPEVSLPQVAFTAGTFNTINVTLTHSTETSFDLNVKGSAWAPLLNNVGASAPTSEAIDIGVMVEPYMQGKTLGAIPFGIPLLLGPSNQALGLSRSSLTIGCASSGPNSASSSGETPITTDQDFGTVKFEDPFPATWPRVFRFCQTTSVPIPIPGLTTPVSFNVVASETTVLPTTQIAPLIGPVQNPTIQEKNFFSPTTVSPTGVTLSWTAPSGSPVTGYEIAMFSVGALPGGGQTYLRGPGFYTTKTSATLPPLQAGTTCVFVITAMLDGAANFETSPNRSALPTASASIVSAPITISTGP